MSGGTITEIAGGSITTQARGDISLYADNIDFQATEKVVWNGKENGVVLGTNPRDPDEGKVLVKSAYFAKSTEKKIKTVTTKSYTVAVGDTHASVARANPGVSARELRAAHSRLTPGAAIELNVHEEKKELTLEKVPSGILGATLFVVVETVGLQGKSLTIEILGSNNTTFVAPDEVVTVLAGGEKKTSLAAVVGAFAGNTEYTNAASFTNKAIVELKLRPKEDATLKEWRKKVGDSTEKKAFLHLKVKAEASEEVTYYNEDEATPGTTTDKGIFQNKKDKWFETVIDACTEGIVTKGFINNEFIRNNAIESCNKNLMSEKVRIIVLHRTAGGKAAGTLSHMEKEGYGAHFVVDYDGQVYQAIGINKKGSHMGVKQFQSTKTAGWGNDNSIGIETCGYSLDKDENKRVGTKYNKIPHDHWEPVTQEQAKSVACLLKFLLGYFSLTLDDVKVHEKLCSKEPNEGQDVYDSMISFFNLYQ